METWDYYISRIWKSRTGDAEYITAVFLHNASSFDAKVDYVETDGEIILRMHPDASTFDDLESAIQMQYLMAEEPAQL